MWTLLLLACIEFAQGGVTRVIVSFRTRQEAERSWNISGIPDARIHKQYGRRLVLEFSRELDRVGDIAHIMQAIGPENVLLIEPCEEFKDTDLPLMWDRVISEPYSTHVEGAWLEGRFGSSEVVVALIDSGISIGGRQMLSHHIPGYDFISYPSKSNDGDGWDADPTDPGSAGPTCPTSLWHGTRCASFIAANGTLGIWGAAPNVTLLSIRTSGLCGRGNVDDKLDAILWAAGGHITGVPDNQHPANIISISSSSRTNCSDVMQSMIDQAKQRGAVIVVSAGNDMEDAGLWQPCNCKGVICVAATGPDGALASYSNTGSTVSMSAPGGEAPAYVRMLSCSDPAGTELTIVGSQGTSYSTPNVAGLLALNRSSLMPLPPNVVGGGAGIPTSLNTLPLAVAPVANGTLTSCYADPISLVCAPCASFRKWTPTTFQFPLLHFVTCSDVAEHQGQTVFDCGGTFLYWDSNRWWLGPFEGWLRREYWGTATLPLDVTYIGGEAEPAKLIWQELGAVNAVDCVAPLTTATTMSLEASGPTSDPTTASTLAVPTTASTLAVPTTASTLAVPTTASTLAVHTTASTLAVPTTASTLAVPTTASTLAVPTTASTLVVPTTTMAVTSASATTLVMTPAASPNTSAMTQHNHNNTALPLASNRINVTLVQEAKTTWPIISVGVVAGAAGVLVFTCSYALWLWCH